MKGPKKIVHVWENTQEISFKYLKTDRFNFSSNGLDESNKKVKHAFYTFKDLSICSYEIPM